MKVEIFKPQHMRAISNNSSLYMYIKISKPILKQRFYIYIPTHKSLNFKSDWFIFMKNNFRPRHSNFNFIQRQRSPYNIDMAPKYLTFCATFYLFKNYNLQTKFKFNSRRALNYSGNPKRFMKWLQWMNSLILWVEDQFIRLIIFLNLHVASPLAKCISGPFMLDHTESI